MKPSILIGAASIIAKNKKLRIAFIALQLGYLAHTYLEKKYKKENALTN